MNYDPDPELRLGVAQRRVLAAVLRASDEGLGIVFPELADVFVRRHGRVDELAVLPLDLADVDVQDRLAVLVQAQRAHRAAVELYVVQGLDESGLVLEAPLDEI